MFCVLAIKEYFRCIGIFIIVIVHSQSTPFMALRPFVPKGVKLMDKFEELISITCLYIPQKEKSAPHCELMDWNA